MSGKAAYLLPNDDGDADDGCRSCYPSCWCCCKIGVLFAILRLFFWLVMGTTMLQPLLVLLFLLLLLSESDNNVDGNLFCLLFLKIMCILYPDRDQHKMLQAELFSFSSLLPPLGFLPFTAVSVHLFYSSF